MNFPFGDPITVITRTKSGVDSYGDDVFDVFAESSVVVTGAFAPAGSSELTSGGDQVVSQPQAFLPFGTVVGSNSVLLIRGDRYEVDGAPNAWRNPFTGAEFGVAVPLKRAVG